jgi:hypothetical protein
VIGRGTITAANLIGPLAGQPLSALIAVIEAGGAYVNVHTNDGVDPPNTGPGDYPGGVPWEPDSIRLARTLAKATGYPYPPLDTGCEYTGTLADWAVENGVGAAVDMELANHRDTDFNKNLNALKSFLTFEP